MRNAASLLLCLLLSACGLDFHFKKPEPAQADCAATCWEDCPKLDEWDGTADQAAALVRLDGAIMRLCRELHHGACRDCLLRLERNKVIKPH